MHSAAGAGLRDSNPVAERSEWGATAIGHDCNGDALTRWHPEELPLACQLPSLNLLTAHRPKPDETFDHAQRAF